jgi:hypothetical protein
MPEVPGPGSSAGDVSPVETKVAASAAVSVVSGVVTWILVTYVPGLHGVLPPTLADFLPWAVSAVLSAAAAYRAPHTTRPGDRVPPALSVQVSHLTDTQVASMQEALVRLAGSKAVVLPPRPRE